MKSKVLFICKGHQNIAGAQLYLQQLTDVFPSDKYDLHYAFQAKDGTRVFDKIEESRYIQRWEYDWRHLSFGASYKQARKLLSKLHPNFILFNSNEDEIVPALLAACVSGIQNKIMVVHWALDKKCFPLWVKKSQLPFPIVSRYSLKMRTKRFFTYLLLDKLLFVNHGTRQAYMELYKVHPDKCRTIYNGIDVTMFSLSTNSRKNMRAELGVAENEPMILATGNLSPVKGHTVLIEAVADLVRQGKAVRCFIAGQGELQGMLEDLIDQKKITRQCRLLGYRDDIPQLLAATDIFCMPSLNEALGYSLIEAMAAGKPVVASRVGGIPEVVTESSDGLLVQGGNSEELSSAISHLIDDEVFRNKIAVAGVLKARSKFSNKEMTRSIAHFLGV